MPNLPHDSPRTRRPLNAAILIGGQSRRMGQPKHLLEHEGKSILDHLIETVAPFVSRTVLVGNARLAAPSTLAVLKDYPNVRGPLAGNLSALHSDSNCDWLVVACDMPAVSTVAVDWLIRQHRSNTTATLAILPDSSEFEPLLAIYTPLALPGLLKSSEVSWSACSAIRALQANCVNVPAHFAGAWTNVNTPEEWAAFRATEPVTEPHHA